jgi:hypothetical protein
MADVIAVALISSIVATETPALLCRIGRKSVGEPMPIGILHHRVNLYTILISSTNKPLDNNSSGRKLEK